MARSLNYRDGVFSELAVQCLRSCLGEVRASARDEGAALAALLAAPPAARRLLGKEATAVRSALIGMALDGFESPAVEAIVVRAGLPEATVRAALERLRAFAAVRLDQGRVVSVFPLSFAPGRYLIRIGAIVCAHAICGASALVVPALFESSTIITVRSVCPISQEPVTLVAGAGQLLEVSPSTAHLGWGSSCGDTDLFADGRAAQARSSGHPEAGIAPIEPVFLALRRLVLSVYYGTPAAPGSCA